ncbi:WD40-repeat-containing domain protein [Radiomyces spectabilis]|uniref:WD40-repeat-containing domain protein n=1 Tax=Radiomyces spectabilis TaxID=64574 RepID=UPI0022204651|nr:WD40-repeat-containing domain protein [Radiomyces spectabilis]KAI8391057.1 WD40-repeat-containing domain protein [Radiomyces spectabilis]
MVKWIPGSEDLFMASFRDGSVMIFDKDRDDQPFTPSAPRSWAEEQFQVTTPHKHPKHNPVSHWRVSEKSVAGFAFSPNGSHVAIVGEDGLLRTVNYSEERLCDVFGGYYGKLLCVAWSPDNQYILTGGQDDLVTIWAFREQKIVARCQGHKSWVTGVAFDPWQCNEQVYRFASVGEDCTLILWDFSVSALHRPKQNGKALNLFRRRSTMGGKKATVPSTPAEVEKPYHVQLPTIHPVPNKTQVPYLQPITVQTVHADPCVDILFRQDCIVTTDRRGRLRKWGRPQQ